MPTPSSRSGHSTSKVRVIPGLLSSLPTPPPPPRSPAPKPSYICKLAVLGDSFSGKTSLVHKFIYRRYANKSNGFCSGEKCEWDVNTDGAASGTSNSIGTSFGASTCERSEPKLADYHKKDITIWHRCGNNVGRTVNERETLEQRPVCVRVQLWDMNIHQHFMHQQCDPESSSFHSDLHSPGHVANISIEPLLSLLKCMDGFIISCRCPPPPSPFSSNASNEPHTSNLLCREWPDLYSLEKQIHRWIAFLCDQLSESQHLSIFVFLSCADLVVADYSPKEWVQLSVKMEAICKECSIASWKLGTCMDSSNSDIGGNCSRKQQPSLLYSVLQSQKLILDDAEDAIEAGFVEMISMHLDQPRV